LGGPQDNITNDRRSLPELIEKHETLSHATRVGSREKYRKYF